MNMPKHWKSRFFTAIKLLIVLLVAFWVVRELMHSWKAISSHPWRFDYGWLAFSALLYAIAYLPACAFWHLLLRRLGQRPGVLETLRAYFIGHLGKYVPGKAMVVILRAGLLRGETTRPSIAAAAVFFETLTMMAAGAFLAAAVIILCFRDHPYQLTLTLLSVGMMVVSTAPLNPPLFRFLAKKLGVGRGDPEIDEKLRGLDGRALVIGWLLMGLLWILLGVSLWASIRGLGFETGPLVTHLPRFTAAMALSTVLGFLAMIPGGLGVREWALTQLLTLYFAGLTLHGADAALRPETIAFVAAAMQRLLSILAELAVSAVLLPFSARRSRRPGV